MTKARKKTPYRDQRSILVDNFRHYMDMMHQSNDGGTLIYRYGIAMGYAIALIDCGVLHNTDGLEYLNELLETHNKLVPRMKVVKVPIKQTMSEN